MKVVLENDRYMVVAKSGFCMGDYIHYLHIRDDVGVRSRHSIEIHQGGKEYHIDDPILRYMNHSFRPNCHITSEGMVIALTNIEADEEMTFNYLTTESKIEEPFTDIITGIIVKKYA